MSKRAPCAELWLSTASRGGVLLPTPEEAEHLRARVTPNWALLEGAAWTERTFRFEDFRGAFAFVARRRTR